MMSSLPSPARRAHTDTHKQDPPGTAAALLPSCSQLTSDLTENNRKPPGDLPRPSANSSRETPQGQTFSRYVSLLMETAFTIKMETIRREQS